MKPYHTASVSSHCLECGKTTRATQRVAEGCIPKAPLYCNDECKAAHLKKREEILKQKRASYFRDGLFEMGASAGLLYL